MTTINQPEDPKFDLVNTLSEQRQEDLKYLMKKFKSENERVALDQAIQAAVRIIKATEHGPTLVEKRLGKARWKLTWV